MSRAISVRLDEDALRALAVLQRTGLGRSEAIRVALVDAAERVKRQRQLRAEVEALEGDELDREEMLRVSALMENLRAPW